MKKPEQYLNIENDPSATLAEKLRNCCELEEEEIRDIEGIIHKHFLHQLSSKVEEDCDHKDSYGSLLVGDASKGFVSCLECNEVVPISKVEGSMTVEAFFENKFGNKLTVKDSWVLRFAEEYAQQQTKAKGVSEEENGQIEKAFKNAGHDIKILGKLK